MQHGNVPGQYCACEPRESAWVLPTSRAIVSIFNMQHFNQNIATPVHCGLGWSITAGWNLIVLSKSAFSKTINYAAFGVKWYWSSSLLCNLALDQSVVTLFAVLEAGWSSEILFKHTESMKSDRAWEQVWEATLWTSALMLIIYSYHWSTGLDTQSRKNLPRKDIKLIHVRCVITF